MKIKKLCLLFISTAIFGACISGKKTSYQPLPVFSVTFGKTGGFTNINPVYTVNNTGNILKQQSEKAEPVLLKKLPPVCVDSVYLLIKQTNFLKDKISIPGNISNYLELKQDTLKRRIIWSDNSQLSPATLKLHLYLLKMIKH
jgi:hypothetical protein